MYPPNRLLWLATAAFALTVPAAAFAQSANPVPAPTASSAPTSAPAPAASEPTVPARASTTAPAPAPSSSDASTSAPRSTQPTQRSTDVPADAKIKEIKSGTLTRRQVVYGLTHPVQEAKQLLKMKTVNFDNLRVYRLPASLQSVLKVSDADSQGIVVALLGPGVPYAQATGTPALPSSNGNNSPIQYLRNVLANINVSNALNNLSVLNGSNVNVNVALSNVLNNNKVSIGQVVGLYIGGGGIITTITK